MSIYDPYGLEPKVREFIRKDNKDNVSIDWSGIRKYELEHRGTDSFSDLLSDILIDENVLSIHSKGNYSLMNSGVCLNPRRHIFLLHFTKKEYAEKYKKEYYSNAMYYNQIEIFQQT